jgi:hypothetical protein
MPEHTRWRGPFSVLSPMLTRFRAARDTIRDMLERFASEAR